MHNNHIQYIELYAQDLDAVKDFYTKAFGWTFTDYGPGYTAFSNSGVEGGFEKVDSVTHGGPLIVLYHENLETALEGVKTAGGKITKEIFDFPGGRRFHFTDPAGNQLAIWSANPSA